MDLSQRNHLAALAKEIREDILRMSYTAQSAHTGGALSCVEILITLYFSVLHNNPKKPLTSSRDRFVFSKAHDAKALYAVLAKRGYFDPEVLQGYELYKGKLPGHTTRFCVPGVEFSAGSLGHGLPLAVGTALALKKSGGKQRVYVLISDGECDEGTTWESALFASHHHIHNLTVIIDYNKLQGYGRTSDILELEPLAKKWKAFGWNVTETDGHSFAQLYRAFTKKNNQPQAPNVIIAHTIKGKGGVPKHIDQVSSQYKSPTKEEFEVLFGKKL